MAKPRPFAEAGTVPGSLNENIPTEHDNCKATQTQEFQVISENVAHTFEKHEGRPRQFVRTAFEES